MPCWPIFGASPDSINDEFVIEVKCPMSEKTRANYVNPSGAIQPKFYAQIQLQMLMCGRKKGLFCVASPSYENDEKVQIIDVDYDDEFISEIIDAYLTFWKKAILFHLFSNTNVNKRQNKTTCLSRRSILFA